MKDPGPYKMTVPTWALAVLVRSWRSLTTCTLLGFMIAGIATAFMSPQYRVTASLLFKIGREQVPPPVTTRDVLVSGQPRAEDMVSKMEIMGGQPLVTEVVDSLGVDFFLQTAEPRTLLQHIKARLRGVVKKVKRGGEEILIKLGMLPRLTPREKVIDSLLHAIEVEQVRRSDVVQVALMATDQEAGVTVVNRLLDGFMAHHLELYRTPQALDFFEKQSATLQGQLKELEAERMEILANNAAYGFSERRRVLVEQQRDLQLQLAGVQSEMARLDKEIPDMQATLKTLPEQELTSRVMGRPAAAETLDLRLAELQTKQEARRAAYAKDSRPMREAEEEIARLRTMKESGQQWIAKTETFELNDIRSQLQRELLAKKDARIGLTGKERRLAQELSKLDKKLRQNEEAGDQLHRVEREIANLEQNYLLYKKKLEEVRISEAMDVARISSVTILNPATATIRPVKPARFRIMAAGTVAGLCLALAFALAKEAYRPAVHTRETVTELLGAPVLAEIEETSP